MPVPQERSTIKVQSERAILAAVRLPDSSYDPRDPFGELQSLAEQAGAVVVGTLEQRLERPVAGTYMGSGKVKDLRALAEELKADVIIFDHDLSPRQLANIEEVVEVKVLDRSELILDIFAARATTTEAKLQVELAQLEYTYPRLRAMWSHLERIVGAGGLAGIGTRGPGEQQLEIDRRLAQKKQLVLKRELEVIQDRKRRTVRDRLIDHFTVGLVGYTNAGKSTLFNSLTAGGAYADDRLFATLVTRTREWDVGGGVNVQLSDTVGFVRDLPHNLIASFKATLEEATHAHVLLIVLDVSDPAAELHYQTVMHTLDELFAEVKAEEERHAKKESGEPTTWREPKRILLLNKIDKLEDNSALLFWQRRATLSPDLAKLASGQTQGKASTSPIELVMPIVAKDAGGTGHAELISLIRQMAEGGVQEHTISVQLSDSRTIDTLEKRGQVISRNYDQAGEVKLRVKIGRRQLDQLRSLGARMRIEGEKPARAAWKPSPT